MVRRHVLPVVRPVRRRGAVHRPADLHQRIEEELVVVLRPLEHDVLEQVGKPGLAALFVLGADVVPDVHGGYRQRAVGREDYIETIGESDLREVDGDH